MIPRPPDWRSFESVIRTANDLDDRIALEGQMNPDDQPPYMPKTPEWVRAQHQRMDIEQPEPVPNDQPHIADLVLADIRARKQLGIERYGTPLQAHNGRDALRDAYEEVIDLALYLRQAIEERNWAVRNAGAVIIEGES